VIIDELGYIPFPKSGGALLFHLISKLYETTSIIITMNRPEIIGDSFA
jgi:DNA replication protein DnaC